MYLREYAAKSAKLTRWALGLQEFMHADSNIFHTVRPYLCTSQAGIVSKPLNEPSWFLARRLQSISQSIMLFRVVQVTKSLPDPLEVGNSLLGISDNVRE